MRAAGLLIAAALAVEVLLRAGVPPNVRARQDREVRGARVLVLGDSFSLDLDGMAVGLLKADLAVRGVTLVSLAQPGFGPRNYRDSLNEALASHRPDVAILNYYVGNDVSDTMRDRRDVPDWRARAGPVLRRSYVAALALDAAGAARQWWRMRGVTASPVGSGALNPFLVDLGQREPAYLAWNLDVEGPDAQAAWQQNQRLLTEVRDRCREAGVALRVHIWPSTLQVNASHASFYRALGFRVDDGWTTADRPQRLLREFCGAEGLDCRDWLPALRAERRELYLERDDHWNADGHRVAFGLMRADLTAVLR
ncbi:MAG: hypothetical protein AB7I25_07395 [Vicinamibacterales bacterium]